MNPAYSVLMSVYKKENPVWFQESVESMLEQSIPPDEIVIVKDGALTEELERILLHFQQHDGCPVTVVDLEKNMGLGVALQKGVLACKNEIIARMDTDDYAVPNRMEVLLQAMEQQNADIVSCNVGEFVDNIKNIVKYKEVPESHEQIYKYAKRRNPFNHPAVVFRKSKVLEAGNYQKCDWIEDYDLWIRMLLNGCRGYNIQSPLLLMRVNENAYKRRGGVKYLKSMLAFNKKMLGLHWYGFSDFLVRSFANIVMAVVPNRLRNKLYKRMLRR